MRTKTKTLLGAAVALLAAAAVVTISVTDGQCRATVEADLEELARGASEMMDDDSAGDDDSAEEE